MKTHIPIYVQTIMDMLEKKGYSAYVVGGSIRDILIGKKPNDYDIATDAKPEKIKEIFSGFKTIDIGKSFGTIALIHQEGIVEVTTFRKDGRYIDGRKPEEVSFSDSIIDDLGRRDFTINAMAYNNIKGIIDPYSGRKDLLNGVIKTVGCPEKRFNEDYLRILRAIRFATQLGFVIDEQTLGASKKHADKISMISMERIADEFFKILLSNLPSNGIILLEKTGILKTILPEIIPSIGFNQRNPHHTKDVYNHILCVLDNSPPIIQTRLAALFHDIGKPYTLTIDEDGIGHFYGHDKLGANISKKILRRLKVSNELIDKVYMLVIEHMNHHVKFKEKGLKKLIRRLGEKEIFNLISLQKSDIKCSNEEASIDHIIERENLIRLILSKDEAYDLRHMQIGGNDLIELGFKEGKIIGEILEYLLDIIIEKPQLNDKEILKKRALERFPIR